MKGEDRTTNGNANPSCGIHSDGESLGEITDISNLPPGSVFNRVLDGMPEGAQLCASEKSPYGFINTPHKTLAELTSKCLQISDRGNDAYYGVAFYGSATYTTPQGKIRIRRTVDKATGLSSWIADVDVGEEKAESGKGYRCLEEAFQALNSFCDKTGIPHPNVIVLSGSGLHLYWTTGTYIAKERWIKLAKRLKKVFLKYGFLVDPSRTADPASVLRPDGTRNFKNGGIGTPVTLHKCEGHVDPIAFFTAVVAADRNLTDQEGIDLGSLPGHPLPADISDEMRAFMSNVYGPLSEGDIKLMVEAVWALDPDMERPEWIKVLFALKDAEANGLKNAKELALAWSKSSRQGKFDATDFERTWASAQPGRADSVHYPTIFYLADKAGWQHSTPDAQPPHCPPASPPGMSLATGVTVLKANTYTVEPIQWLWVGWLARGKVHILAGIPGTGKTSLAMALGATITLAGRWPDGSLAACGDILIWSAEDDPADTLIPRLVAAGADLDRVHIIASALGEDGRPRSFDPSLDMDKLADHIATMDPKPALLIVDPIVSAVAGDSHKNAEVRRALQPLVDLALTWKIAVLGITHFTKGTAGADPIDRVTGSLAFAALARIVLVAAKLPDEQGGGRVLARGKSNIGKDDGGFGYELVVTQVLPGIETTQVLWGNKIHGSARDILAQAETHQAPEDRSASDEAQDWLKHHLAAGPQAAKDLRRAASADGISNKSLRTAREKLQVHSTKEAFTGGWVWTLPAAQDGAALFRATPTESVQDTDGTAVIHHPTSEQDGLQELEVLLARTAGEDAPSPPKMPEGAEQL